MNILKLFWRWMTRYNEPEPRQVEQLTDLVLRRRAEYRASIGYRKD